MFIGIMFNGKVKWTDGLRCFRVRPRAKNWLIYYLSSRLTSHFIIAWYDDCCQNRLHGNTRATGPGRATQGPRREGCAGSRRGAEPQRVAPAPPPRKGGLYRPLPCSFCKAGR